MNFNIQPSTHIIRKGSILIDDYKLPQNDNTHVNSSRCSTISNSFLKETERNEDIDEVIRYEIERRFKKSVTNATYKFPRQGQQSKDRRSAERKLSDSYASVPKMRKTSTHKRIPSVTKIASSFSSLKNTSKNPQQELLRPQQGKKKLTRSFMNTSTFSSLNVSYKKPTHVRNATDFLINQRIKHSKSPSHAKSTKVSPSRNKAEVKILMRLPCNKMFNSPVKIHRSSKSKEFTMSKTFIKPQAKKSEVSLPSINAII